MPAPRAAASRSVGRRTVGGLVLTAVLVLAADAISKAIVVAQLSDRPPVRLLAGLVYLVESRNSGAAFGLATGMTVVLSVVAIAVVVVIARVATRLRSRPWAIGLGLILGGALGNLADRIFRSPAPFRGAVVDWISLFGPTGHPWPIFNIADSCLVVGVCLVVLLELIGRRLDGSRVQRSAGD